uniref:lecithin retinol acyltransferase family protein n=1 Tax=Trichocoleus desertorum TaxID=1481672 RepID=UPI0025B4AE56|nr:lecithin retinol acyltransferase family protein [Trichocoleus desertorum]
MRWELYEKQIERLTTVKKGDHIYVDLGSCKQHGIYVGEDLVIYWTDQDSKSGQLCRVSLAEFTQGANSKVRKYACRCIDREKTIKRAETRFKEEKLKYQFINSKDFAIYCRTGLKMGDHIYADYGHCFHHGIYCGDDEVIHYVNGKRIDKTQLSKFAKNQRIHIKRHRKSFSQTRVVKRAKRRLGERNYNLIFNNCEHFANWCKTGKSRCKQGEQIILAGGKAAGYEARKFAKEAEKRRRSIVKKAAGVGRHIAKSTSKFPGIRIR